MQSSISFPAPRARPIRDNVAIHEGVLVGGGSVVTRDAAAGSKLYGVPAHPVPTMRRFGPTPRD